MGQLLSDSQASNSKTSYCNMADTVENLAEEVAVVTQQTENLSVQEVAAEVESSDTVEEEVSSEDSEASPTKEESEAAPSEEETKSETKDEASEDTDESEVTEEEAAAQDIPAE